MLPNAVPPRRRISPLGGAVQTSTERALTPSIFWSTFPLFLYQVYNMHNNRQRAALYARVSSDAQAGEDKVSLGEQMAALKDYCRERDIEVADVFQDIAPGSTARRPAFQAMLEGARKGQFIHYHCLEG